MRPTCRLLALPLIALLAAPPAAFAQAQHVVDPSALATAVGQHADSQQADRAAILDVLGRAEVRDTASRVGIDLARVRSSVATLDGADLARAEEAARQLDQSLVGGASNVTISTTTIIIGLLVLILLIVALR